jgi:hypothetical protein
MESDAEHIEPERDIKALLDKHTALITEVKAAMAKELDPVVHDDIYILRYVLSYKTLEKVLCVFFFSFFFFSFSFRRFN